MTKTVAYGIQAVTTYIILREDTETTEDSDSMTGMAEYGRFENKEMAEDVLMYMAEQTRRASENANEDIEITVPIDIMTKYEMLAKNAASQNETN